MLNYYFFPLNKKKLKKLYLFLEKTYIIGREMGHVGQVKGYGRMGAIDKGSERVTSGIRIKFKRMEFYVDSQ